MALLLLCYGASPVLLSDSSSHLVNSVTSELFLHVRTEHTLALAYFMQANYIVERANKANN